jgi:inorganic triphosphatase YgiF
MHREVEIKLDIPAWEARALARASWLNELACGPVKRERLVSVYYDTSDLRLHARHAILRVRQTGDRFVQTFKAQSFDDGPLGRLEWESPVDGLKPELRHVRRKDTADLNLKKLRKSLKPIFETTVSRRAVPIRYRGSLLELAIDQGQVKTGRRRRPIHEIEVELKEGKPYAVIALSKQLASKLAVAFGVASKAERGYALRQNKTDLPVFPTLIVLSKEATAEDAFQVIATSCLRHFAANREAVKAERPEGVHQMRVGLRRLRAAISIFKEMLHGSETERIKTDLKWLTEELGPARDMDVLIKQAIGPLMDSAPAPKAVAILKTDIAAKRDGGFVHAKTAVDSDRFRRLVLQTAFWIAGGQWRKSGVDLVVARRKMPVRRFAVHELDRCTAKVIKKLAKIEDLDPRQRHKLRIAIKKLRYATEYFETLFSDKAAGRRRKRFERGLKALQSSLGKLNDIRVHGDLARTYAGTQRRRDAVPKAFAMGILTGKEDAEDRALIKSAKRRGKRFTACKAFWK